MSAAETKRTSEADDVAFALWEEIGLHDGDVRQEGDRVSLSLEAAKRALAFLPSGAMAFPPND